MQKLINFLAWIVVIGLGLLLLLAIPEAVFIMAIFVIIFLLK